MLGGLSLNNRVYLLFIHLSLCVETKACCCELTHLQLALLVQTQHMNACQSWLSNVTSQVNYRDWVLKTFHSLWKLFRQRGLKNWCCPLARFEERDPHLLWSYSNGSSISSRWGWCCKKWTRRQIVAFVALACFHFYMSFWMQATLERRPTREQSPLSWKLLRRLISTILSNWVLSKTHRLQSLI